VLNAAARLVCSGCKNDQVTPMFRDLHWLPFPERIMFRLAPFYLSDHVADANSRRRLRSISTAELLVPRTRLSTVGDRAFPNAAARAWNNQPPSVTAAPSVYFQKVTQYRTFSRRFLSWRFTCVSLCIYYLHASHLMFIFKRCVIHRIVPFQLNLAKFSLWHGNLLLTN